MDKHPQIDFYRDFEVADVKTDSLDYTWTPVWGEEDSIRCHYNELTISLKHKPTGRDMAIRFRLFNDGLGFRYEFGPMAWPEYFIINDELTEFAMAEDYTAFWIPGTSIRRNTNTHAPASPKSRHWWRINCFRTRGISRFLSMQCRLRSK